MKVESVKTNKKLKEKRKTKKILDICHKGKYKWSELEEDQWLDRTTWRLEVGKCWCIGNQIHKQAYVTTVIKLYLWYQGQKRLMMLNIESKLAVTRYRLTDQYHIRILAPCLGVKRCLYKSDPENELHRCRLYQECGS